MTLFKQRLSIRSSEIEPYLTIQYEVMHKLSTWEEINVELRSCSLNTVFVKNANFTRFKLYNVPGIIFINVLVYFYNDIMF